MPDYSEMLPDGFLSQSGEVAEFRTTLSPETDRGCALMAASYLELQLEELLSAYFVEDESVVENLLGVSRPLGTFSSRIDLAYALGLIGLKAKRDLHLIRKIRNLFAHDHNPIDFEDHEIANRCRELHYRQQPKSENPRSLFTSATLGVLAVIHVKYLTIDHMESAKDVSITEQKRRESTQELTKSIQESIEEIQEAVKDPEQDVVEVLIEKIILPNEDV